MTRADIRKNCRGLRLKRPAPWRMVACGLALISSCAPVLSPHPDAEHLKQIDALVAERATARLNASVLLATDPKDDPEPPAGELHLDDAVQRSLSHNLSLVASAETLPIAQAQLAQAGLWQNPNFGQSSGFFYAISPGGGATTLDFLVTQTINTFITQPTKVGVATAQRFQAGIDLANQGFTLSQQAESKYQEMVHDIRNRRLAERAAETYHRAVVAAEAQVKVGFISTADVNRARIQYEDAQRQIRHLQTQYERAAREMNWIMGVRSAPLWRLPDSVSEPPRQLPALPEQQALEALAVRYRLDLMRAGYDQRIAAANIHLADLGIIPQITLGYDVNRDQNKHVFGGPQVSSITLPIFDQGLVALEAAKDQAKLAEKKYAALEGQVRQDVRTALASLRIAQEDVQFYRDRLIPQEEENVQLAQRSFQLGNSDLDNLLNTLREYYTVLQGYEDAIQAYHDARVSLEQATGLVWDRMVTYGAAPPSTRPATTRPSAQ